MAEIRPFRGLLYSQKKIEGDYSGVVAPPYDVISPGERDQLYEKSPYNIIRLILGKASGEDDARDNKYTRAKEYLEQWQQEGILAADDTDSFYVYLQEYEYRGIRCSRLGFIGLMKIGETGSDELLPHENTLAKPKEDRMNLIKQVESNLSPIFSLYNDSEGKIKNVLESATRESEPIIDITVSGVRHALWKLSGSEEIRKIVDWMVGKNLFIADGHHRYEVAKMYRDMRRQEDDYDGSADYVMMYFTDMADPENLTVMATHRAVKEMPVSDDEELSGKLKEYFTVTGFSTLSELMDSLERESRDGQAFGYYGGGEYLLMKSSDRKALLDLIEEEKTGDWKSLDVSILHSAVFEKILGVSAKEGNITYVKMPEEAGKLVDAGSHDAAFFLNPTRVEQLKSVAEHREMMPQKSTYFYPKLLTGLVINKFEQLKVTT
ncbi:MAG: DUF1015 family protein [Candidatus Omnitrophica bacterium]|nr:DUF1015 family protein [Candidatus Omnitrophota bacterium]